jgi:hypothetical protein
MSSATDVSAGPGDATASIIAANMPTVLSMGFRPKDDDRPERAANHEC